MAHINLLPWRQEERERRNKEFITLAAAVTLLALLTAFATWSYFNNELAEQLDANALIEQENARLDTALTEIDSLEQRRDDIVSRMQVIQDLQGRRPVPVHLWDDIAKAIPSALYLNNLKREDDLITLTGKADNPNVVSNLIRNLDNSEWMDNSAVRTIQQDITAYASAPTLPQASTTTGEQPRPTYPEDSYVQFVVTTEVQHATETEEDEVVDNNVAAVGDAS